MSNLLAGALGILVATNQLVAASNLVAQTTGMSISVPDPNDPVEKEYKDIMIEDDKAQAEVDDWIRDNNAFRAKGGGATDEVLNDRIRARFAAVAKLYEDFLSRHPDHANAHIAYGSFLADTRQEDKAVEEWEKARQLNPKDPAPWNNLANIYGHDGPVTKAFEYYAKAIELNPKESLYYQNLATTVFLFRKDAREYYNIDEQQVFNKSLDLYRKALQYDPDNFELAHDIAQTYYGIRPFRTEEALNAWTNAFKLATTDIERQGVYIHYARINLNAGHFAEARQLLGLVSDDTYTVLKERVLRNIEKQEKQVSAAKPGVANAPAARMDAPPVNLRTATAPP